MKYILFFLIILLIPSSLAYGYQAYVLPPQLDGYMDESDNDGTCETTAALGAYGKITGSTTNYHGLEANAAATDCYRSFYQWSLVTIPDTATIQNVELLFDVEVVGGGPRNCDVWSLEFNATNLSGKEIFNDAGNGTEYVNNNTACTTTGNDKTLDLGASADANIQTHITTDNFFGIGFKSDNEGAQDATTRWTQIASGDLGTAQPKPTLRITYVNTLRAVTTLTTTDIRPNGVDLDWDTPSGAIPDGYQINYTTPWNPNVATIQTSDTSSTTTSATVSGLAGSTQYSFRIGSRSGIYVNGSGNVINITTDVDPTASFSPGTFTTHFDGTDVRTIKYTREDLNSTDIRLNVTASNTYQLACNFHYKFAALNKTYTNIANSSINANEDRVSFRFHNVDNEIIDVLCWDQYTNTTARYLITQTFFPFLEQIDNFRNGTYGTVGMFGALDFISMIAVICSMIGFNRVNETVGIIFGLFMIGALAVLSNGSIISWASTFTVGFAVLVMWAIGTTRKD